VEGSFDLGDRSLFWDLNYARSNNEANQTNYGSYNIRRINLALGPVAACNADPQCVPLDIFNGVGSITQQMLGYIQPVVRDYSENNLQLFSANLSGDLFDMPGGPLAFAAGVEHRTLDGLYRPDALTVAGEYNGVPSLPTQGEYDVDEFFTEFNIPVYANADSQLDLSLAGRYSDYSTFGGETTGKAGFRWQFSSQFLQSRAIDPARLILQAPQRKQVLHCRAEFGHILTGCVPPEFEPQGLDGAGKVAAAAQLPGPKQLRRHPRKAPLTIV
jgi:iron complex outermembrane receptor protein